MGTGKIDECKLKCAAGIAYIPDLKFLVQEKIWNVPNIWNWLYKEKEQIKENIILKLVPTGFIFTFYCGY